MKKGQPIADFSKGDARSIPLPPAQKQGPVPSRRGKRLGRSEDDEVAKAQAADGSFSAGLDVNGQVVDAAESPARTDQLPQAFEQLDHEGNKSAASGDSGRPSLLEPAPWIDGDSFAVDKASAGLEPARWQLAQNQTGGPDTLAASQEAAEQDLVAVAPAVAAQAALAQTLAMAGFVLLPASVAETGTVVASEGTVLVGQFTAGPVVAGNGLSVKVYDLSGKELGSGKIQDDGSYRVPIGNYTGAIVAKVLDTDSQPDFMDEATGKAKDLNAVFMAVDTITEAAGAQVTVHLNALTTVAAVKAGLNASDGSGTIAGSTDADKLLAITSANATVAKVAGASSGSITQQKVIAIVNADGSPNATANAMGKLLAAVSGIDDAKGGDMAQAIQTLASGIIGEGKTATLKAEAASALIDGAAKAKVPASEISGIIPAPDTEAPLFVGGASASRSFAENASGVVYIAQATDNVAMASFEFGGGADDAKFNLDPVSGALSFKSSPDHDRPGSAAQSNLYAVNIRARDAAGNSAIQAVAVSVTDINDNPPVFASGSIGTVAENAPTNTLIYTAVTTDADGSLANKAVSYSLKPGVGDAALLDINASTGAVTLKASAADYESNKKSYSFTAVATNAGTGATLSAEQAVTVSITDLNDNPPVFISGTTGSVDENAPIATAIYSAASTDADGTAANRNVVYSLKDGGDKALLDISSTGVVTLKASADYESSKKSYSFTVVATNGSLVSEQAVTVSVNDLNDNAPVFTSGASGTVAENAAISTAIYTPVTTDADGTIANRNAVYSLKDGGDKALLDISSTGVVTLKAGADYETKTSYSFTVVATNGSRVTEQAVTVSVTDANDNAPVFTSGASSTVAESAAISTAIYTPVTTDADGTIANRNVVYSLKDGDDKALLDISSTGVVTLKASANYEAKTSYSFTVVATNGALVSEQAVTVSVNDLNDNAPVFTSGASGTVAENAAISTAIYTPVTTDADGTIANRNVVYSLKDGGDKALLDISSTGVVTLRAGADYESKTSYSFTVVATNGTLVSEQAVTVSVNDLNDNAPVFTSGATGSVDENAPISTAIYTPLTTDADGTAANRNVVYSLKDGGDKALLDISSTGVVTLKAGADYETKTSYSFTVVATNGALVSEQAVTVSVNDLNDNAPVFTSGATGSVDENAPISTAIYTPTTTDADGTPANRNVVYSLKDGGDKTLLDISSTGAVTLKASADYESNKKSYSFTVVATNGSQVTEQAVTVSVNDLNDNAPVFTSGATGSVDENASISTAIYTPITTDADGTAANRNVVYSLKDGGDKALLNISSTGEVTLKASADYESTKKSYSFTVVATNGSQVTEQAVTVSVNDLNEAPIRTSGTLPPPLSVDEDSAESDAVALGLTGVTYAGGEGAEASQTLSYRITAIPSFVTLWKADGTTAVTTATGGLTLADLQGLKYKTVANANGSGNITWTVTDSGSGVAPNVNVLTESLSISITAVNDAPTLGGTRSTKNFVEVEGPDTGGKDVNPINETLTVSDIDGPSQIASATVTITNAKDGDALVFDDTPKIQGAYSSGVLTLTAKAGQAPTNADFQAALRSVKFNNNSDTPDTTPRSIEFRVTDKGQAQSGVFTETVNVTAVDDSYSIDLVFPTEMPDAQRAYFTQAATTWSRVIRYGLPDVTNDQVGHIDDMRINVGFLESDGVGNLLAMAGESEGGQRSGLVDLPFLGYMRFDPADIEAEIASGAFADTVLHEMAHALGFNGSRLAQFVDSDSPFHYTGVNALTQFQQLAGQSSASWVPLENTGSDLTAGAHWSEEVFGAELMTGYARGARHESLSRVTLGAFEDLGYTVDYTQAEAFELVTDLLPGFSPASASGTVPNKVPTSTVVYSATASGSTSNAAVQGYGLSGEDALLFRVNSLGQVTFRSVPDYANPADVGGDRIYHFNLVAQGDGNRRAIQAVTLTLLELNAAPTIGGTASVKTFTEVNGTDTGANAVAVNSTVSVTDADSTTLSSATVSITNVQDGDALALPSSFTQFSSSYANGVLSITAAPGQRPVLADFQAALRAVTFNNTSDTPNTTDRSISFLVNDGNSSSTPAFTQTVKVVAVADAVTAGVQSAQLVEAGGTSNSTAGVADANVVLAVASGYGIDFEYLYANGWASADSGLTFTQSGSYGDVTLTVASATLAYHLDDNRSATQSLSSGQAAADKFRVQVTNGTTTAIGIANFGITGASDADTQLAGDFVAGPARAGNGLTLQVYDLSGRLLGSSKISDAGSYNVNIGSYVGGIVAKVVDATSGPDFWDEATNQPKDLDAVFMAVASVAPSSGAPVTLHVNALTTVAAAKLGFDPATGSLAGAPLPAAQTDQVAAIDAVNATVARFAGIGSGSLTGQAVVATVNADGTPNPDANNLGKVAAAISGLDKNNGNMSQAIQTLANGIIGTSSNASLTTTARTAFQQGGSEVNLATFLTTFLPAPDSTPPVFAQGSTASVGFAENGLRAAYLPQVSDNVALASFALDGGADADKFSINTSTGALSFKVAPDFEAPGSATNSNAYVVNIKAYDAAGNSSSQAVTVNVTDLLAPTSTQAFALWQEAEQSAKRIPGKDINALNQYAPEIQSYKDSTSADGSANQGDSAKRMSQWVNQVTGTDIVSAQEYSAGFSITGKAAAGAGSTVQFRLDKDRTTGNDGDGAQVFGVSNAPTGVAVQYDDTTGDWTLTFAANSGLLKPATHNTYGSGVHQLVVDTNGNGSKDTGEASRLFLVADGTASSADTGTVAKNYSVQDKISGDVFVYYYGNPDGAGVGLNTSLDYRIPTGTLLTDTAANPGLVILDRDGTNGSGGTGGDVDYYSTVAAFQASAAVTASNTALRLVIDAPAKVWEFHMAQRADTGVFGVVNAKAADHTVWDSNTSRMASLEEAVALYAANFNGTGTVGAVQPITSALSVNSTPTNANNTPLDWPVQFYSAAPTPSGHALMALDTGILSDIRDSLTRNAVAVL